MSVMICYNTLIIILVIEIVWGKNFKAVGPPISYIVYCVLVSTIYLNSVVASKMYNKIRDLIVAGNCHNKFL